MRDRRRPPLRAPRAPPPDNGAAPVPRSAATDRGRERVARSSAAVAVGSVVVGWGVSQWPYLIVPDMTAAEAAAPKSSLGPIAIGLAVGAALVLPSLLLLFRVFKASRTPGAAVRSPDRG